ncbi:MAG: IS481 family transposase [Treponema sp.]|nr:IS481 family transposase [Treponema sp.]
MGKENFESGLKKYEVIAPLLSDDLEPAQKRRLRKEITEKHNVSERTLRRYLQRYSEKGYEGLLKKERYDKGASKSLADSILEEAIQLRRELPGRSVRRIISILESEGIAGSGQISKSTLSRHLAQNGCSPAEAKTNQPVTKRFQKENRNALWQADIKYGPYIAGKDGKKTKTYILAMIDDATRIITHAEIYDNQRLPILEDCFRKALQKFGVPEAVYIDNGKIFVSKWFRLACARLGIRHINTKPYSPQSKGKIERFNGLINEFLEELSLEPADSLVSLNQKFRVWLEEGYNHKPHSSLGGKSPFEAYRENAKKIRFASSEDCHNLFLWEVTRTVDKTGAVKQGNCVYDAGSDLMHKKVDVRYDPFDLSVIEIWSEFSLRENGLRPPLFVGFFHDGLFIRKAAPLIIQEYIKTKQTSDQDQAEPKTPSRSRLLAAYEKSSGQRDKQKNGSISFVDMEKGGGANV